MRMRLLNEILPEIKKIDPETALTKNAVRQLGLSGAVPVVMVGRKRLYNLDALMSYLENPPQEEPSIVHGIRPVSEKLHI